ncbi:hypothetical protein JHK87_013957 [Glycine soja]|nr:hypothetical protein JHK87_013957 [Glycine soja]
MHPTPFYHKSRSIAQVEGTEATTSSSSSISHRLNDLQDLQENTDKLLQLRIFQQALAQECSNKQIDELLVLKLLISSKPSSTENFQSHVQSLELCIEDIEVGVERLSRQLIRTRVTLLNILSH